MGTATTQAAALRAIARALVALADALEQAPSASTDELLWVGALEERKGIQRLIAAGKLRSTKIGRKVFVSRRELLALLDAPAAPKARVYSLTEAVAARSSR